MSRESKKKARYLVGIDLGTSNSVLAYIDTLDPKLTPRVLSVPQLADGNTVVEQNLLPSAIYIPHHAERLVDPLSSQLTEQGTMSVFDSSRAGKQSESGQLQESQALSAEMNGFVAVGERARLQQSRTPARVITSAKSWLSHSGVDRLSPILPWGSTELDESHKLSPVAAATIVLGYLGRSWEHHFSRHPLAEQVVTVTVPASFDEVAQRLTKEAVVAAGLPENTILLEEPQAAFLSWMAEDDRVRTRSGRGLPAAGQVGGSEDDLLSQLVSLGASDQSSVPNDLSAIDSAPPLLLVCDIGGGTTDLSLFAVGRGEEGLLISRVEVSDHILLGGDNIDLAIAHFLESSVSAKLSVKQWHTLVAEARGLKEGVLSGAIVSEADDQELLVSVPAEGSGLFANLLNFKISQAALKATVLEGFFPQCSAVDRPRRLGQGLRELGLPYPADSAITRHIAAFLNGRAISAVLYTGGTLKPDFLRKRLTKVIAAWQEGRPPAVLDNEDFEHGVALGAAHYSLERSTLARKFRGGHRIRSGYPRSIYVEVGHREGKGIRKAVCLLPKGVAPNTALELSVPQFSLLLGSPVRFSLFYSNHRPDDQTGQIIDLDQDTYFPLAPLHTVLSRKDSKRKQESVQVRLVVEINELNLFSLSAVELETLERHQLEFNLRGAQSLSSVGGESAAMNEHGSGELSEDHGNLLDLSGSLREELAVIVRRYYGKGAGLPEGEKRSCKGLAKGQKKGEPELSVKALFRDLERVAGPRSEWSVVVLRAIWEPLERGMSKRQRGAAHEAQWLRLAGFCLRPGYGAPLDPFRVDQLWRVLSQGLFFPRVPQSLTEWWIMWRRVAGGLSSARQAELFRSVKEQGRESNNPEYIRLLGSLERLPTKEKRKLALELVAKLSAKSALADSASWSLARILSRVPLYAESSWLLPPNFAEEVVRALLKLKEDLINPELLIQPMAAAARLVGVREVEITPAVREEILKVLKGWRAPKELLKPLREIVPLDSAEKIALYGEALPSGLRLEG